MTKKMIKRDFLIVKYRVSAMIHTTTPTFAWAKITAIKTKHKKIIEQGYEYEAIIVELTRRKALSLVDDNELEKVVDNEDGTIWDSGEFQEKYGGRIYIPSDM